MLPLYLPLLADDGTIGGLIGLLSQRVLDYSSGSRSSARADPEHLDADRGSAHELIEGIIAESEDEALMERYLAGDELVHDDLIADLETAVARGALPPGARRPAEPASASTPCSSC